MNKQRSQLHRVSAIGGMVFRLRIIFRYDLGEVPIKPFFVKSINIVRSGFGYVQG